MATRTARRGLGARVILAAIAVAVVAGITSPASADSNVIVDTSVQNGWAALTRHEEFPPGGRLFDPTDPPYQRADGPVDHIAARWRKTICQGAIVVLDKLGAAVPGTYSETNHSIQPFKVQKLTFTTPLKASGAPFTATFTAGHLESDGTCTAPVSLTQKFALDRFAPAVPTIATPEVFMGTPGGVVDDKDPKEDVDSVNQAILEPGAPVVISGEATDPLTWYDEDRTETSGISSIVIRLYRLQVAPFDRQNFPVPARSVLVKEYVLPGVCGGVISDPGLSSTGQPACDVTAAYSQDITADLNVGTSYAVTVHALDLAGDLDPERTAQMRGGESESVSFTYLG